MPESLPLYDFLVAWHGEPDRMPSRRQYPAWMPYPLWKWHDVTSCWSKPLTRQNRVVEPTPEPDRDGEMVVFWIENQGVYLWGYPAADTSDSPEVFIRENEVGAPWQPTGINLSDFLHQVAVFEAVMGADNSATAVDVTSETVTTITGPLAAMPLPSWNWPGPRHQLWMSERVLASTFVNDYPGTPVTDQSLYGVYIAGKSSDDLAYLDALEIDWAHNTRTGR